MEYKVVVTPLAQKDIEKSIEYYAEVSADAPLRFIHAIENAYKTLEINPLSEFSIKRFTGRYL